MASLHPAKFGGHKHCGSGDMMFVVVEGQNSTCRCLDPSLLLISKVHGMPCSSHEISGLRHKNIPVCPMKDSQSWSHMSRTTTDNLLKNLLPVRPKAALGIRRKKRMEIAKPFALHANTIKVIRNKKRTKLTLVI